MGATLDLDDVCAGHRAAAAELAALRSALAEKTAQVERLREALGDADQLLKAFECTQDEDSLSRSFFKAHTSEDWFYHVCFEIEKALAATEPKDIK